MSIDKLNNRSIAKRQEEIAEYHPYLSENERALLVDGDSSYIPLNKFCALTDTPLPTGYYLLKTGKIPAQRIGARWRMFKEDVIRYLAGPRKERAEREAAKSHEQQPVPQEPSLASA